jgi:DNA ligase 1
MKARTETEVPVKISHHGGWVVYSIPRSDDSLRRDFPIPPLMHGNDWHGQDVAGWWCSEKFNGWRAYWDGERLISRTGRDYAAPGWFTADLPWHHLDCKLWLGRGMTTDDVHKAIAARRWKDLFIVVLDVPGMVAEKAIETIRAARWKGNVIAAEFFRVESTESARDAMRRIVGCGGEGIMLRKPRTLYRNTRTDDLLKLKP